MYTTTTSPIAAHAACSLLNHTLNSARKITSRSAFHRRSFNRTITAAAEVMDSTEASGSYDAAQIQVLQGLDPVRKRPGMYIGSTGQRGLHHLIYEILDNSIDEVQAGQAKIVTIELNLKNGWVTVTDDGRGIPIDTHPTTGKSALETVLTVLHAGGKFGGDSSGYNVSGGLHGVGLSVVNALSTDLEVSVWREGVQYSQSYKRGAPQTPLEQRPPTVGGIDTNTEPRHTGTSVSFKYDETIFSKTATFDPDTIRSRLRELAFLNSAATIKFRTVGEKAVSSSSSGNGTAAAVADWEIYHYSGGLTEYVTFLNRDKEPFHSPLCYTKTVNGVTVDVAMQWCSDAFSDTIIGFVNSIKTVDGGTHIDGFKVALTRTVNNLAKKAKTLKEGDSNLSGEHIREGLGAVISVKVPNPEFEGQTKTRLGNPEVRRIVENVVASAVSEALESDPGTLGKVLAKALQAFKAAEAAKKARELVRRKSVLTKSTLPGKLADCTSTNKEETEIFIVEGDSAGGSAKQARDRRTQAILPLRGKILNVEKQDDAKVYKNNELSSLIVGLGLGLKGEDGLDSLRYGKIIILTDADVDGAHIRTLLLTFLFRYQRALFEQGRVYAGVPPLYKVELNGATSKKNSIKYAFTEEELKEVQSKLEPGSYTVQRFKGLGEMMPLQLWETTLNPHRRTLRKLTVEDAAEASHMFTLLMGDKVGPRRELIERHGSRLSLEELDF